MQCFEAIELSGPEGALRLRLRQRCVEEAALTYKNGRWVCVLHIEICIICICIYACIYDNIHIYIYIHTHIHT